MKVRVVGSRKSVVVSLILRGAKPLRKYYRAPARKLLSQMGVENILQAHANQLENAFPGRQFSLIPLRDGNFNIVESLAD
jgi:hypothetical protein